MARAGLSGPDRLLRRSPGERPLPQVVALGEVLLTACSVDPPVKLNPVGASGVTSS